MLNGLINTVSRRMGTDTIIIKKGGFKILCMLNNPPVPYDFFVIVNTSLKVRFELWQTHLYSLSPVYKH